MKQQNEIMKTSYTLILLNFDFFLFWGIYDTYMLAEQAEIATIV